MSACECGEPISQLDEKLDDLVKAMALLPDLPGFIEGLLVHERLAAQMTADTPGVVDVLTGTDLRRALIDVALEVLAVQVEGADGGSS